MMARPFTDPADGRPSPVTTLRRDAGLVRDLYARCDYAGVLGRLVNIIPSLHIAAHGRSTKACARSSATMAWPRAIARLLLPFGSFSMTPVLVAVRCQ